MWEKQQQLLRQAAVSLSVCLLSHHIPQSYGAGTQ
jgi:hypothetical protein